MAIGYKGGVNLIQALMRNVRNCRCYVKGEIQVRSQGNESTNAQHRGGVIRSSDEVFRGSDKAKTSDIGSTFGVWTGTTSAEN